MPEALDETAGLGNERRADRVWGRCVLTAGPMGGDPNGLFDDRRGRTGFVSSQARCERAPTCTPTSADTGTRTTESAHPSPTPSRRPAPTRTTK